ncbi:OstA-like protein [Polluticoccus soli]|uniref:OstA-like protein n=1 Tax=Polluticoccus soli TaxID=3034150 RepID=UPI0023E329B2|nr:OstA-like protein [Flavipsychrobacter sp. JY13-12]
MHLSRLFIFCLSLAGILLSQWSFAQNRTDTAGKVPIEVMPGTGRLQYVQTDSGAVNKLIGNVILKQGENMMYCDSAYFFLDRNTVEAFGNVRVVQPGSEATSDYMRYLGNTKLAYMKGNVMLTDGQSNLWSEEVEYNTGTKIGVYNQGGTVQNETTTLSSNAGVYDMRSKNARFTGEVIVTDPEYHVVSEDLGYNTETKLVTFYSPSVVTSDSSILQTSDGTYDSKNKIAHFISRSSVWNKEQYIESDILDYDRTTGIGVAIGNVISLDTIKKTTLYSGRSDYNEKKKTVLATIKPVLKQINGKDSIFIRADTLFSAAVNKQRDSIPVTRIVGKGKNAKKVVEYIADTTDADSSDPRYFIGYHHVKIFSDSLQGVCDSISYSTVDSIVRMMIDPIAWSRNSQITGDTILLYMDSSELRKIYVPNNAFMISQSGPPRAELWDQVQGKTLTGNLKNNTITDMLVRPDAQAIYYAKDDNGAYIGVNEASSERMRILFRDQGIYKIIFEQDVKQKMTPLNQADLPNMKLSRYQWHVNRRPRSLAELFE